MGTDTHEAAAKKVGPTDSLPKECPAEYYAVLKSAVEDYLDGICRLVCDVRHNNPIRCSDCEKNLKCLDMIGRIRKPVIKEIKRLEEEHRLNTASLCPFFEEKE